MQSSFHTCLASTVIASLSVVALAVLPTSASAQTYTSNTLQQTLSDARDQLVDLLAQINGNERQSFVAESCLPSVAEQIFGTNSGENSGYVSQSRLVDYIRCAIVTAQQNDESVLESIDSLRDDIDDLENNVGGIDEIDGIADIGDVSISNSVSGQILQFDGSNWTNVSTSSLGISGANATGTLGAIQFSDGNGGFSADASNFFWEDDKNALRAGQASSTNWDTGNIGAYSVAFGNGTLASATSSAAFGNNSTASGESSIAFGSGSRALDFADVAFGSQTTADSDSGAGATAFGSGTYAQGTGATVFGSNSTSSNFAATAFGSGAQALGSQSVAFGSNTTANDFADVAFGSGTTASGGGSGQATAFGSNTTASNFAATAFGSDTTASGSQSTAFGSGTVAGNSFSTAFGSDTVANGQYSLAAGSQTLASGPGASAFGSGTVASNNTATAFGQGSVASGIGATAFGSYSTSSSFFSTAFGSETIASGAVSTAFGQYIEAAGEGTFAVALDDSQTGVSVPANTAAFMGGDVGIGTVAPQRRFHVLVASDTAPVRFEDSNGYCEIDPTSTTWTCTSDERLKKDITALNNEDMLERLSELRPVSFVWKSDDTETQRTGLIAQEVEGVFPEIVNTDEETGYKSVSYGGFIPRILSGMQKLRAEVTSLFNGSAEIDTKEVQTEKLCVGDTCVTESELKQLLEEEASGKANEGGLQSLEKRGEDTDDSDNDSEEDTAGTSTASSTDEAADGGGATTSTEKVAGDDSDTSTSTPATETGDEGEAATSSDPAATSSDATASSTDETASSTNAAN